MTAPHAPVEESRAERPPEVRLRAVPNPEIRIDQGPSAIDGLLRRELVRRPIFSEIALVCGWAVILGFVVQNLGPGASGGAILTTWVFALVTGVMVGVIIAFGRVGRRRIAAGLQDATEALRSMELVTDPALSFLPLDDLLNELLARTTRVVEGDVALIELASENGRTLTVRATRGLAGVPVRGVTVGFGEGLIGSVALRAEGIIHNDAIEAAAVVPGIDGRLEAFLATPLLVGDRVTGVVVVASSVSRRFRRRDLQLLKLVADRLAASIERGRLDEAERRSRLGAAHARLHLQLLARAAEALGPALESYDGALRDLVDVVVPAFADWFAIDLVGEDGRIHRVAAGPSGDDNEGSAAVQRFARYVGHRHPEGERIVREVIDSGQAKVYMNTRRRGPIHGGEPAGPGQYDDSAPASGIDSMLVVPIHVRGLALGAMSFVTGVGRRGYRRSDLDAARSLAGRVGVAMERVRLWREGRETEHAATRHAEQLARLVDAALAVNAPLVEHDVLDLLAEHARRVLEAERAVVFSPATEAQVEAAAAIGSGAPQNPLSLAARELVRAARRPLRSSESRPEHGGDSMLAWAEVSPARQWIGMPIRSGGADRVLVVVGHVGQGFDAEDESMLILLGQLAASALDNARLYGTIHENEQRLSAAVESSPLAIAELDLEGGARWWNPAAEELFGWAPHASAPRIPDLDLTDSALRAATERAALGEAVVGLPIRSCHEDGGVIEISLSLAPLRREDGTVGGILALVEDVTERRRMWEQVQRTERLGAMARLAGGIAHDFNNLLTVILGSNEIVQRQLQGRDESVAEELGAIRRAGERAAELTSRLLSIGHRGLVEPVIVDPDAVVKDMEPMLRRILGDDISLELAPSRTPLTVRVDPAELERAILNLAINARDAMPSGGRFSVRSELVSESAEPDTIPIVSIAVGDTGVGMDPAVAEHCFEPLFTTKPPGQGTGLGLTAVHAAITQAGGRVTVDTAPDLGTTFTLWLPFAEGALEPAIPDESAPSGGDEILLLVEDEDELRRLTARELEWRGYHVVSAASGAEALAEAEQMEGRFDLLVTDIAMPSMSGVELAGKLGARWGSFPVLYVSGHIDRATLDEHSLAAEGVSTLSKPYTPEVLARRVRRALEAAQTAKAAKAAKAARETRAPRAAQGSKR